MQALSLLCVYYIRLYSHVVRNTPYSKMAAASDDLGRVARERAIEGHDSMFTCLHVYMW